MEKTRDRLRIIDLGAGRGERLAHLEELAKNIEIAGSDLGGYKDGDFYSGYFHKSWKKGVDQGRGVIRNTAMESQLGSLPDNSVDLINSDMCLGYYDRAGKLATKTIQKRYARPGLRHLATIARIAFKKIKPTPEDAAGKGAPVKKYFVLRLQRMENLNWIVSKLRRIGFVVKVRPLSDKEHMMTDWLRAEHANKDLVKPHIPLVQIYAYKPGGMKGKHTAFAWTGWKIFKLRK